MGSAANAVAGPMIANRTNSTQRRALNQGGIYQDVNAMEGLTLSYNDLLAQGKINPQNAGQYRGLQGNQSILGRDLGGYFGQLSQADPAFGGYQQAIGQTAQGLAQGGLGLPADVQRNIENTLRSAQSSRGLLDSDTSAIQETAALMGGSEAIRSERLNQVSNYLSGVLQPAIGQFLPSMTSLYGGELQRAMQGSRSALGAAGTGVQGGAAASSSAQGDLSIFSGGKGFGG
jgi:hypothetical protein